MENEAWAARRGSRPRMHLDEEFSGFGGGASASAPLPPDVLRYSVGTGKAVESPASHSVEGGTPLEAAETARLLKRLPPPKTALLSGAEEVSPLPEESIPAPRTGEVVAAEGLKSGEQGPQAPSVRTEALRVLRAQPSGEVSLATQVSVTFSQAMVALGSDAQRAATAESVPVRLSPVIPGARFVWVSTRTLAIQTGERLPMATEFTIEVPAGTRSAAGGALSERFVQKFRTPAPALVQSIPSHGASELSRNPELILEFNQKVDPSALFPQLSLRAGKVLTSSVKLKLFSAERLAERAKQLGLTEALKRGRLMALEPEVPLDPATSYLLTIPAGVRLAEGPLPTQAPIQIGFQTYSALEVVSVPCAERLIEKLPEWNQCRPGSSISIQLNHEIDAEKLKQDWVKLDPAPKAGAPKIEVHGSALEVKGLFRPGETFTVRISPEVQDVFGQRLGDSKSHTVKIYPSRPQLVTPPAGEILLAADAGLEFPVIAMNQPQVDIQVRAVSPADFRSYLRLRETYRAEDRRKLTLPGKVVFEKTLKNEKGESFEVERVPLSAAMPEGVGSALVTVHLPPADPNSNWEDYRVFWIYKPKNLVELFSQSGQHWVRVTSALTGKPVAKAKVRTLSGVDAVLSTDAAGIAKLPSDIRGEAPGDAHSGEQRGESPASKLSDWSLIEVEEGGAQDFITTIGAWGFRYTLTRQSLSFAEGLRSVIYTDRPLYRPGEEVQVHGWLRRLEWNEGISHVRTLNADEQAELEWKVVDPRGGKLASGKTKLGSDSGDFDLRFAVPKGANLGTSRIEFTYRGALLANATIQVQEFRRPEFELTLQSPAKVLPPGATATFDLTAKLYAGGSSVGLPVNWVVRPLVSSFTPPGWHEFTFGGGANASGALPPKVERSATDSDGHSTLLVTSSESSLGHPWQFQVTASVQDLNRQNRTAQGSALIHSRDRYLGLRARESSLKLGHRPEVEAIFTDVEGKAQRGARVTLELWQVPRRYFWGYRAAAAVPGESKRLESVELTSVDQAEKSAFKYELAEGSYELRGKTVDSQGRAVESVHPFQVYGLSMGARGQDSDRPAPTLHWFEGSKEVTTARVGHPLRLKVSFSDAVPSLAQGQVLAVVRSQGREFFLETSIRQGIAELEITPASEDERALEVLIEGISADGKAQQEAHAYLNVDRPERKLEPKVSAAESRPLPGSKVRFEVKVRDSQGKAASNADLLVFAVDDSLLALRAHSVPDPSIEIWNRPGVQRHEIRRRSQLTRFDLDSLLKEVEATNRARAEGGVMAKSMSRAAPGAPTSAAMFEEVMFEEMPAPGSEESAGSPEEPSFKVRSDFRSLAFFETQLVSDDSGQAHFEAKLPDSVTRYTIFAVALDRQARGGTSRETLQTGMPFFLRPSLPRFLSVGDQAELSVLVQNQTKQDRDAHLVVRVAGLELQGDAGRAVRVPAGEAREVRFPVRVTKLGNAIVQLGVLDPSSKTTDATEGEFPLYVPGTIEAFAVTGTIQQKPILQPVQSPKGVEPGFGALEVSLSSTRVQALTDAWVSLLEYPFECNEQLASKVLAIAALKPVVSAFPMPSTGDGAGAVSKEKLSWEALQRRAQADIDRLLRRMDYRGRFGFWDDVEKGSPFVTVHAAHALVRAKAAGLKVPAESLDRVMKAIHDLPAWFAELEWKGNWTLPLEAYALRVRSLSGEKVGAEARQLLARAEDAYSAKSAGESSWSPRLDSILKRFRTSEKGLGGVPLEILGHLLPIVGAGEDADPTLAHEIHRVIGNRVTETAGSAHLVSMPQEGARLLLHSEKREEAIVLEALVETDAKNELLPKLVDGILGGRKAGRWLATTQENAFILLGVGHYFQVVEKEEPHFDARVWLGERFRGGHRFEGRTTESAALRLALKELGSEGTEQPLVLGKDGPGKLYYRVGMKFAPKGMVFGAEDRGFEVSRTYEGLDHPEDVKQDPNGTWRVKPGARVLIRTRVFTPVERAHVALIESFPAGFEPETIADPWSLSSAWGGGSPRCFLWWGPWYSHRQLRDSRAEAFAETLPPGEYELVTVARATGIGKFTAPPARAEEMYAPDVWGRSRSEAVWISGD